MSAPHLLQRHVTLLFWTQPTLKPRRGEESVKMAANKNSIDFNGADRECDILLYDSYLVDLLNTG